ncbi:MAG: RNA 2',3'-cyclic phosphodiesterase [Acidobacteria bacterium]|nr:RNA 2',3'-cyclic phosphodiesterase [Acidobacteriota bacterium]MBU1474920.1 RNA 2',3'-cyclic phosphodiesterase [Acidobacteriota bacterium]MBU4495734.1 RNA 2',3'-cyclic phosphodiesterase [Acidobacteriota bacterium]
MRTFIAVEMNPDIIQSVQHVIRDLDEGNRSVRWVKAGGIHLTLKFLGDITADQATRVAAALEAIGPDVPSFPLRIAGTGAFPPGNQPRVLWVGIDRSEELLALVSAVEIAMARLGFPSEKRPFRPHISIGRVKDPTLLGSIPARIEAHGDREFGQMTVRSFLFFESRLNPAGAEYSVLKEIRLP